MRHFILFLMLMGLIVSCQVKDKTIDRPNFDGDYVTRDYFQRADGYDWSVVSIRVTSDSTAHITVRSRNDKKKPTCTFEGVGFINQTGDTLTVESSEETIHFSLAADTLSISSPTPNALYYYCSGGASLTGKYIKLHEALDEKQLKPNFDGQAYSYANSPITYHIHHAGNRLAIVPSGLTIVNDTLQQDITGYSISNIEVGDLNIDSYPELFVYLVSDSPRKEGKLIAYSPNNGKSVSEIYLPDLADNNDLAACYKGHDEMAVVENTFCRRFPLFEDEAGKNPTGKYKQVQYKLVDNEAGRILKIEKVIEF